MFCETCPYRFSCANAKPPCYKAKDYYPYVPYVPYVPINPQPYIPYITPVTTAGSQYYEFNPGTYQS